MIPKPTIAVYVPKRLYRNDVGITIFVNGLYRSIAESGTHRLLKITPGMCTFRSQRAAEAFVEKHNIVFVMYHESRSLVRCRARDRGLDHLEACVPFLNPKSVHIADDKIATKHILHNLNIPVVPDTQIRNREELLEAMSPGELYVAKPHNSESGWGVRLIKRNDDQLFEFLDGSWQKIGVRNLKKGIEFSRAFGIRSLTLMGVLGVISAYLVILDRAHAFTSIFFASMCLFLCIYFFSESERQYLYRPILMLEPFFADSMDEFYCLRCTVLGDTVVESAKKWNTKNVTPNISHGGTAVTVKLSREQEALAVAATRAVGATYAGIDLLYAHGQTVVCEVNVGPIGVYCEQTGVDVGELMGTYALQYTSNTTLNPMRRTEMQNATG
jgi:glutathione synthase/RimK-type ligase-like ATP-grasp enzyme